MSDDSVRHLGADPTVRRLLDHAIRLAEGQADVIRQVLDKLAAPEESTASEIGPAWLDLMATLGVTSSEFRGHLKRVAPKFGLPKGATDRMLAYLLLHVGESVPGEALAGVAGIDSWSRRLRELRVEHGWPITLPEKSSLLGPGTYRLEADRPDERKGESWQIANRIRRSRGANGKSLSGKARMLEFFKANVGREVTKEMLEYVSYPMQERPRRVRELTEEGWQIDSSLDRRGMAPGSYYMTSLERLAPKARQHIKQRNRLLEAAGYRCALCRADAVTDRTIRLQVHHKKFVSQGGTNDDENLEVLCDACHAGKHSVDRDGVVDELLRPEIETRYA